MNSTKIVSTGSLLTAITASLCCIGPLVLSLLGISGIALFSVFENYRPIFMILTLILLGFSLYYAFRKKTVRCEDGTCKAESSTKFRKSATVLIVIIAIILMIFPYFNLNLSAKKMTNQNEIGTTEQVTNDLKNRKVILAVEGMTCSSCANGIKQSLIQENGIISVESDYKNKKFEVVFNDREISIEKILDIIKDLGYKPEVLS